MHDIPILCLGFEVYAIGEVVSERRPLEKEGRHGVGGLEKEGRHGVGGVRERGETRYGRG